MGCAVALLLSLAFAGSAAAATCSDYDTQAEAQRAADTIDADGDGIYCEALPCPCLKPGAGRLAQAPDHAAQADQAQAPGQAQGSARAERPRADVAVLAPGTVEVRTSRAGRSPGLKTRERVRLIGLTAPAAGRCGYQEALAQTLTYAFGDAARDTNGDGLADTAPAAPREFGALVDIRTDAKVKARDAQRRLHAYLDAGHTGVDLGRELVASGWAAASYGQYARSQRMRQRPRPRRALGAGAWLLCHADFDRPAGERFDGYTACPATFSVDGQAVRAAPARFVRHVIVAGGDCESAYPTVSAWITSAAPGRTTRSRWPTGPRARIDRGRHGREPGRRGRSAAPPRA